MVFNNDKRQTIAIHYKVPILYVLMTFAGLLLLILNFVLASWYCPQVTGCQTGAPNWFFLLVAWNLWVYQTLDNIDGKQARRTGSSSPLGELFDHGCDSLFLVLTGIPWFIGMNIDNWDAFIFLTQGTVAFYGAHWEEFHTHKLILGVVANPTECQYFIMSVFAATGIWGKQLWDMPVQHWLPFIDLKDYGFSDAFISMTIHTFIRTYVWIGIVIALLWNGYEAYKVVIAKKQSLLSPIFSFLPYAFQCLILWAWASWSRYGVIDKHSWMFLCMHGFLFSFLCDQIMLARICRLKFPPLNPILLIPALGALNVHPWLKNPIVPEEYAMPILFGIFMSIYFYFIITVVLQFASHLKIKVFTIPYPPKQKSS